MLSRFGYGLTDIAQIPRDLLSALGFEDIDLTSVLKNEAACAHLASALLAYAREHYDAFAHASKGLPSSLRPAFLPLAPVPATLNMLEKRGAAIFKAPTYLSPLRRQWLITRVALEKGVVGFVVVSELAMTQPIISLDGTTMRCQPASVS